MNQQKPITRANDNLKHKIWDAARQICIDHNQSNERLHDSDYWKVEIPPFKALDGQYQVYLSTSTTGITLSAFLTNGNVAFESYQPAPIQRKD